MTDSILTAEPAGASGSFDFPGDFLDDHVEMYKRFHLDPELSAEEHRTAAVIEARLSELGSSTSAAAGPEWWASSATAQRPSSPTWR